MTLMNHRRTNAAIGAVLAAIAAVTLLPGNVTAATGTKTISAQTAYNCEVNTPPPPPEDYSGSVTASIQFTAPSAVYPGQTIHLSGTLTLQFPENLRVAAIAYGDTSVQGYSTKINVGVDAAGHSTDVFADEWQTPPTPIGDPMQVTGVLTMPPLTVPKNATGVYELQMPENGATPNTAESSPARVAFTAVATAQGSAGQTPIKLACYLPGSSPELGQIPIVAAPSAQSTTSASKSSAAGTVSGSPSSGATKASGTTPASGSGTASSAAGTSAASAGSASAGPSASGQSATVANTGGATPVASGSTGAVTPSEGAVDEGGTFVSSSTPTRSGVYVSTSLLVLVGFLVCLASLGYALLTNYRLNAIRRELDD